jgi:hypothetical protein
MVQSLDRHFLALITARDSFTPSESTVIEVAKREGRFGSWLFLLVAMTIAADGWLTLGPLAQSALMAAALFRRFSRK